MKTLSTYIISILFLSIMGEESDLSRAWVEDLKEEKAFLFEENNLKESLILNTIDGYEEYINDPSLPVDYKIQFLFKIRKLEKELANADDQFDLKFSQFRYKKGIEILKMIYEKILSLDHHFNTLNTFYEIQDCLLYTSPSPRDRTRSRMPSSA